MVYWIEHNILKQHVLKCDGKNFFDIAPATFSSNPAITVDSMFCSFRFAWISAAQKL